MPFSFSLPILTGWRTRDKQTAIEVWQQRMVWYDHYLQQAMQDAKDGKGPALSLINLGGMHRESIRDDGNLSIFRALGRRTVADHWVDMMHESGAKHLTLFGLEWVIRLGHVEHEGFWEAAAKVLMASPNTRDYTWKHALDEAASVGNLVPFEICPEEMLLDYVAETAAAGQLGQTRKRPSRGPVHPDAAAWLISKGLWSSSTIENQINAKDFPLDVTRMQFMAIRGTTQCESGYVQHLCKSVLSQYTLNPEQRVRFVGQAMVSFGQQQWERLLEPVLCPYVQGIDLEVLRAVCGHSPFSKEPRELELLNTLYKATQASMVTFMPEYANSGMREGPGQHEGLLLLMELAPPQDRLDLYHLGVRAMQVERGLVAAPMLLDLPSLD